jgi:flagellar assembly protein FliH
MSSNVEFNGVLGAPFAALQYRDIAGRALSEREFGDAEDSMHGGRGRRSAEVEMTEAEFAARIVKERAEATAQAEQKLRNELEQKVQTARAAIVNTIREFEEQRKDYFARVEAEIVQLSLSIAAKILHREAQVDPMLVATLVRMAVEKMHEDSRVTVRVPAGRGESWKQYLAGQLKTTHVEVVEDEQLSSQDCILETELGSANFGLEPQLKEVEQGFFDLLALRPTHR